MVDDTVLYVDKNLTLVVIPVRARGARNQLRSNKGYYIGWWCSSSSNSQIFVFSCLTRLCASLACEILITFYRSYYIDHITNRAAEPRYIIDQQLYFGNHMLSIVLPTANRHVCIFS
jgi:hypothetical protein